MYELDCIERLARVLCLSAHILYTMFRRFEVFNRSREYSNVWVVVSTNPRNCQSDDSGKRDRDIGWNV